MKLIFACMLMALAAVAESHQDALLDFDDNGQILWLPPSYMPASFDLGSKTLRVRNLQLQLPECLAEYFTSTIYDDIEANASWDHVNQKPDPVGLPPYLSLTVVTVKNMERRSFVFALDTLELLIEVVTTNSASVEVPITPDCLEAVSRASERL